MSGFVGWARHRLDAIIASLRKTVFKIKICGNAKKKTKRP
jgi:hypothetical protein